MTTYLTRRTWKFTILAILGLIVLVSNNLFSLLLSGCVTTYAVYQVWITWSYLASYKRISKLFKTIPCVTLRVVL